MSRLTPSRRRNALLRYRSADDPVVVEATKEMRAARLEQFIREAVDTAPPLSREQRTKLALLLTAEQAGGDDDVVAA